MAKWHTEWKVHPHRPLQRLEDNLQVVDGPVPKAPMDRRMTVVRLADGRLVVHNAMALDDASMAALEAWGTMAYLIVPNGFHRLDAFAFKQRYPAVKVVASPHAKDKIGAAVPIDGGPEILPPGPIRGELLDGDKCGEMVFVIEHGATKTLLLNDALFNMHHRPGFSGFVMRALGSSGGLKLTRIMKTFGLSDTKAAKAHLARLAALPGLTRLIVSHGEILEGADVGAKIAAVVA